MKNQSVSAFQNIDQIEMQKIVNNALLKADDGELFLESNYSQSVVLEEGVIKTASYNERHGYGLRAVKGEAVGFTHNNLIEPGAIRQSGAMIDQMIGRLDCGQKLIVPQKNSIKAPTQRYGSSSPFDDVSFEETIKSLYGIEAFLRQSCEWIKHVTLSYGVQWQKVMIIRPNSDVITDVRPLHRLGVQIIVENKQGRRESAFQGSGGRLAQAYWLKPEHYKPLCQDVIRQAMINCEAVPAPAGEFPVILGPGWPGVLLHEAVGHGLEGDFNRKKTSLFADQMGKQVASKGVTVVDDGTLENRRGSLNVDDEGTPSNRNVLIEDGILTGYLQDRHNAFLMGVEPTGNGRRETYAHLPMPRMTNTFMMAGNQSPQDIIADVQNGVYAANFSGGQVDITSGQFVFEVCEAYKIENGKLTTPLKGAMLIGNGPDVMKKITHIGNDLQFDKGIGTCGKDGQNVPVGVGQPTIAISKLTVGGTAI